jgi:DNA polymerase-3 subunit gamma/tau
MEALPLKGMARQLAANCRLIERSGSAVHLELDPAHEHLLTGALKTRLAEALERHSGGPVRLRIEVGGARGDTPARRQEAREIQRQKQAEASIQADPNVRAMQDIFGATIEPDSIRPVGPESSETDTPRRSHP